jgi:hypothetical protein
MQDQGVDSKIEHRGHGSSSYSLRSPNRTAGRTSTSPHVYQKSAVNKLPKFRKDIK